MKSLHIVNRKGGVGKTTIALHAAWYFAERHRVLFLELDDQRNASSVLQEHAGDLVTSDLLSGPITIPPLDGPGIRLIAADDEIKKHEHARLIVENLSENMDRVGESYDLCVIDSGPSSSSLNLAPLFFATHALAPIAVHEFSVQGIKTLLRSIIGAKQSYNQELDFLGLLPNLFVAGRPSHQAMMEQIIAEVGTTLLFPGYISSRQGYEDAVTNREPVWKENKTASRTAGREIRFVLEKIEQRLWNGVDQ